MQQSFFYSPRDCLEIGATCVIHFLLNGSSRISGILFVTCLTRYGAGREKTSIPFILCFAMRHLASPIIGYLGAKFGSRPVTLAGCLLASIGVGGCFFAEDIRDIIIFWGVLLGIGYGLGVNLIPQILNQDFPNSFEQVYGLFSCSTCVGGFLLPILMNSLINTYGSSGSFLILSAILLNAVPSAMILQTPNTKNILTTSSLDTCKVTHDFSLNKKELKFNTPALNSVNDFKTDIEASATKSNISINGNFSKTCPLTKQEQDIREFDSCNSSIKNDKIIFDELKMIMYEENIGCNSPLTAKSSIKSSGSLKSPEGKKRASRSFLLFADPTYILIILTQGMVPYITTILLTTIVEVAKDKGVLTSQQFYVLICYNAAESLGRIGLGYLRGSGCLSKVTVSASCFFCLAVTLPVFVYLDGFAILMTAVLFYGLLTGCLMVGGAGIVKQYIEKDKLEMGFSALYIMFGITSFSQPFLIGLFRERLQSYNGLFCVLGFMCFIFGLLTLLIPKAERYRKRQCNKMAFNSL